MKILGTGLRGLVGSRVVELLKDEYEFEISDVDITDRQKIIEKIKSSDAQIVLHLAAKTNVDGCEKDREKDIKILRYIDIREQEESFSREGTAWAINVFGTKNVVDVCQLSKKKLIYISTDFVFDGTPKSAYLASEASTLAPARGVSTGQAKAYTENDIPNPINWYGKTKYTGEKIVQTSKTPWIIARIAYPYRANFTKPDFFRAILKRLQAGKEVKGVTDHVFTPTFVDNIAFAIDALIKNASQGIFHVVGGQSLKPFDAAILIANEFNLDKSQVSKTTRAEYFKNRAPRPFQLVLKNDKITKLGVRMSTFVEGLRKILKQVQDDKKI